MILSVQFYICVLLHYLLDCLLDWEIASFFNAPNMGIKFIFYFIYKHLTQEAVFFFYGSNNNKYLLKCISAIELKQSLLFRVIKIQKHFFFRKS